MNIPKVLGLEHKNNKYFMAPVYFIRHTHLLYARINQTIKLA